MTDVINTQLLVFAEAAAAFGEDSVAREVMQCSVEQQRKMCLVSTWLQLEVVRLGGKGVRNRLAEASAAVFVMEGHPRELARKRAKEVGVPDFEAAGRMLPLGSKGEYFEVITPEFEQFWFPRVGL